MARFWDSGGVEKTEKRSEIQFSTAATGTKKRGSVKEKLTTASGSASSAKMRRAPQLNEMIRLSRQRYDRAAHHSKPTRRRLKKYLGATRRRYGVNSAKHALRENHSSISPLVPPG